MRAAGGVDAVADPALRLYGRLSGSRIPA